MLRHITNSEKSYLHSTLWQDERIQRKQSNFLVGAVPGVFSGPASKGEQVQAMEIGVATLNKVKDAARSTDVLF